MTRFLITAAVAALVAGPALAAEAVSTTDLNLRAGPGPQYAITGLIPANTPVVVDGCLAGVAWCKVNYNGTPGWAFGTFLTTSAASGQITLAPDPARDAIVQVIVTDEQTTVIGSGAPNVLGALDMSNIIATDVDVPGMDVTTFVQANPVDPILLDGEVVVGAAVPPDIQFYKVPNSNYGYLVINGAQVIVREGDRKIVSILR